RGRADLARSDRKRQAPERPASARNSGRFPAMRTALALAVVAACSSHVPRTVPAPPPGQVVEEPRPVVPVPDPAPPGLRLSPDIRPVAYDLELRIVPSEPTFSGKVTVPLTLAKPAWVIWLNATDLKVTAATIDGAAARVIPGGE